MRILIGEASRLLKAGEVVGVPTETVYGLAASLYIPSAIEKIFTLKGRPSNNPLIVHVANLDQVLEFVQGSIEDLEWLACQFWPGPLTLVIPIKLPLIPSIARADLPTAAFRIPQHPLALQLIRQTGPLVMPSANLSGRPSSTEAFHVEEDFGKDFPVIDGGPCKKGLESTILYPNNNRWEIIRQGALSQDTFEKALGYRPELRTTLDKKQAPLCPGQLYRHYAPQAKLILKENFNGDEKGTLIGFSDRNYPVDCNVWTLGPLSDPDLVATNLYSILRKLDQEGHPQAYVDMGFTKEGILLTLAERLQKAALSD